VSTSLKRWRSLNTGIIGPHTGGRWPLRWEMALMETAAGFPLAQISLCTSLAS